MKNILALTVGLVATGGAVARTGAVDALSDIAFALPTQMQAYLSSSAEPNAGMMVVAGIAMMLFVVFRRRAKLR